MPLDLEEQEQVDALKSWWNENGTFVLVAVLVAVLALTGWVGWRRYETVQAGQASVLYETLVKAAQGGDGKAMRDAGGALAEDYSRTPYASMGALVAARYYFDRNDLKSAKAQLQWVIERARTDDFRDLARLRLGAVLLDEKEYDEALKVADAPHGAAYDAQFAALKGDLLVAKNQAAEAKAAYRLAIEKASKESVAFRESVRMRLEALGG
jgi:predicted negative regulator of RcsB-dependent stress response